MKKNKNIFEKNGLFITFLLGSFAGGFQVLIYNVVPTIGVPAIIIFFLIGLIISFIFSSISVLMKIFWSGLSIAFFILLILNFPIAQQPIEITYPSESDVANFEDSNNTITIKGKVTKDLSKQIEKGLLDVHVFKFDSQDILHYESSEAARHKSGVWEKKLTFYKDQEFSIMAIAAPSVDIAREHIATSGVYKSNNIKFRTAQEFTKQP